MHKNKETKLDEGQKIKVNQVDLQIPNNTQNIKSSETMKVLMFPYNISMNNTALDCLLLLAYIRV